MKDTYCDYCNPPYSDFRTSAFGYTNSTINVGIDGEEPQFNVSVYHTGAASATLIYDGTFNIPINYCPKCGRKLVR